jgi:hypothetical protein
MEFLNKNKGWLIAVVLLLLLVGVGAAWLFQPDSALEDVRRLQQELFSKEAAKLSPEERQAKFTELREKRKNLTPEEKQELNAARQKKMKDRLHKFFQLPKEQQWAEIDRTIDKMLEARQRWQEGGGQGRGGPWGKGGADANSAAGKNPKDAASPAGDSARAAAWSGMSREDRRKNFLDATDPEFRGQMALYRQMLSTQMQQRGLTGGWGWRAR